MKIEIRNSSVHGRGVFSLKKIKKGEIIEICPVLVMPKKDVPILNKIMIGNYYFDWSGRKAAIALGYGSLYNHSYKPNAKYCDYDETTIRFKACKTIHPNEEITVNYNGDTDCQEKVWFDK